MEIQDGKVRFVFSTLSILVSLFQLKGIFYIFSSSLHRFHHMNVSIYCAFLICEHETNDEIYYVIVEKSQQIVMLS